MNDEQLVVCDNNPLLVKQQMNKTTQKLIGPFKQILTLQGMPVKGALADDQLMIIEDGAVIMEAGKVVEVGPFKNYEPDRYVFEEAKGEQVLMPSMVDCHTRMGRQSRPGLYHAHVWENVPGYSGIRGRHF